MSRIAPHVAELRQLLGDDVLLLSWPWGKKGDRRQWIHLTVEAMNDPRYLQKLGQGNIGVALGKVSGGLCSLDIDSDEEMDHFLELNPEIGNTLRSRGSRGGNLWWRIADSVYPRLKPLKRYGKGWGEWRSSGSQTIIYGRHPDGHDYQILNRVKPVTIRMIQIQWPEGIYPLLQGGSMGGNPQNPESALFGKNRTDATQETDASDVTNDNHATDETKSTDEVLIGRCSLASCEFPAGLILKTIPQEVHTSHARLFELAREIRTFEADKSGRFGPVEIRAIFDTWFAKAKPYLRPDQGEDDYFMEFMKAYLKVKCLIGEDVFRKVMVRARKAEPAAEVAAVIRHPGIRLLASLCRELQTLWGDEPFFLSCRMVEKEFQVSLSTASLWLNGLEGCGFIKTILKGDQKTMQASRFRYLLPH